jgi:hypothetical protein
MQEFNSISSPNLVIASYIFMKKLLESENCMSSALKKKKLSYILNYIYFLYFQVYNIFFNVIF